MISKYMNAKTDKKFQGEVMKKITLQLFKTTESIKQNTYGTRTKEIQHRKQKFLQKKNKI